MKKYRSSRGSLRFALLVLLNPASALGQAHFAPGLANIRDYVVPAPGLYAAVYDYGYITSNLTDNSGNKVSQVFVGPAGGPLLPLNVNVDVKLYALAPMFIWVAKKWNFLGAHYASFIAPTFANANAAAALSTVKGQGLNPQTSQFSVGDLFVQPLWFGWNRKHFDVAAGWQRCAKQREELWEERRTSIEPPSKQRRGANDG